MIPAHRDLALPEPWEHSLERARRKRTLIPALRRRQNRRRRASAALSKLMVAGPASQVFAAAAAGGAAAASRSSSTATRAVGQGPTGTFFRLGSTGEAVKAIQTRLGVAGDGVYGVATERAVRDFQARSGLGADGVVGPVTWTRLMGLGKAALRAGAGEGEVAVIVRERPPASGEVASAPAPPRARTAADEGGRQAQPGRKSVGEGRGRPAPKGADEAAPAPAAPEARTRPVASPAPTPDAGPRACGELRLAAPVNGVKTSPFGPRGGRNHDGVDIAAPTGTPIHAAECGVVSFSGTQGGYGNMVCVEHSSTLQTCYAHMSRRAASSGQTVRKGQVIGYVGTTGHSTGPHVHFETRVNGQARDPEPYLRGGAVPGTPRVRQAAASASVRSAGRAAGSPAKTWTDSSEGASVKTSRALRATITRPPSVATPVRVAQPAPAPVAQPAPTAQPAPAAPPVPTAQPAPTLVAQPAPAPAAQPAAAPVAQPTPVAAQPTELSPPQPASPGPQATPPAPPIATVDALPREAD